MDQLLYRYQQIRIQPCNFLLRAFFITAVFIYFKWAYFSTNNISEIRIDAARPFIMTEVIYLQMKIVTLHSEIKKSQRNISRTVWLYGASLIVFNFFIKLFHILLLFFKVIYYLCAINYVVILKC